MYEIQHTERGLQIAKKTLIDWKIPSRYKSNFRPITKNQCRDVIASKIEQFYLQESSKCLLGRYLKKLSSWELANSGRRSSDSHSRGAHRYPYLGCIQIDDLEGQSDLFKSASVDRIERFWTLCIQSTGLITVGCIFLSKFKE